MNPLRRHYLRAAQERIDERIAELRERRADISIEIQRINRRMEDGRDETTKTDTCPCCGRKL